MKKLYFVLLIAALQACQNRPSPTTVANNPQPTIKNNLDPNTKYNESEPGKHIDVSNDSLITTYLLSRSLMKIFPDNNIMVISFNGIYRDMTYDLKWSGPKGDVLKSSFHGKCTFSKKVYDNSRIIHLENYENKLPNGRFEGVPNKSLDITLFESGTIIINVQDILTFLDAHELVKDTSKYWAF